jgi:hypothetical protein
MRTRRVKLDIPENWHPVPDHPRTYCRDGDETCRLQFTLLPPQEDIDDDMSALKKLRQMVRERDRDLGSEIHFAHQTTPNGPVASSLFRTPKKSLKQFWLIPCEVTILASYSTENMEAAREEIEEAQRIIESMQFVSPN